MVEVVDSMDSVITLMEEEVVNDTASSEDAIKFAYETYKT